MNKRNTFKTLAGVAAAVAMTANVAYGKADQERYIIGFQPGAKGVAKGLVERQGGKVALSLDKHNAMAVTLPPQALKGFANNPNITYFEEDVKRFPLAQEVPYGIPMVQADLLSDAYASDRKVCIIDSGYELAHEDLAGNLVDGTNDPGTGNWYTDENAHGTHVAGTIAGLNNDTGVVGVLPNGNLQLHIVKVFNADGWGYSSSLVSALDVCVENGANVINMSLGGSRGSRTERIAFQNAYDAGVLSIAAAGNDGNTADSYPASYDAVVSVAAVDQNKMVASFSQQTAQVELSGPGVGVVSSVPTGTGSESSLTVAGAAVEAAGMDGAAFGAATGALVDCGIGDATCANAAASVCLIQRGSISFADKVLACEAGGGVGAIIYNNEPGLLYGTMGDVATTIPSIGISDVDGAALLAQLGSSATVAVETTDYAAFDGTSMATPHVAGVAALVWSYHLSCSAAEIRNALAVTAEDLGTAGRDNAYGFGLVQAKDAVDYLTANPCGGDNGGGDTDPGTGPGKGKGGKGGGRPDGDVCRGGPRQCP